MLINLRINDSTGQNLKENELILGFYSVIF